MGVSRGAMDMADLRPSNFTQSRAALAESIQIWMSQTGPRDVSHSSQMLPLMSDLSHAGPEHSGVFAAADRSPSKPLVAPPGPNMTGRSWPRNCVTVSLSNAQDEKQNLKKPWGPSGGL